MKEELPTEVSSGGQVKPSESVERQQTLEEKREADIAYREDDISRITSGGDKTNTLFKME